jgi:hypothetical protein
MNDIYEHKAKKYKYKYLKLKNELEGGLFDNKEKTLKILDKVILDVENFITPVFNKDKFLGLTYSEKGHVNDKLIEMERVNIKDRGRDIKDIYNYMLSTISASEQDKYPKTLFFYFQTMNEAKKNNKEFNVLNFRSKLDENYLKKYPEVTDTDNIFNNMIIPIVRTLDIYIIIMFIKKLFYYRTYSKFDKKTIDLVKKLENDAYKNEINSPDLLIDRIKEIIKSINDSIPTMPTKK